MIFLSVTKKQLRDKKVYFNALLIGSGKKAAGFIKIFPVPMITQVIGLLLF
jgi:hypothetical protein